jgi:hypothetical protein
VLSTRPDQDAKRISPGSTITEVSLAPPGIYFQELKTPRRFIASATRRNDKVDTTHAALVTVSGPTFVYTEWFEMTAGVAFSSWANTWARSAAHHTQS